MFGDATLGGAAELAEVVDTIFLSVKPQYLDRVIESLKPHVKERHLIVSIAAGVRIASLEANLPEGTRVVGLHPRPEELMQCLTTFFLAFSCKDLLSATQTAGKAHLLMLALQVEKKLLC